MIDQERKERRKATARKYYQANRKKLIQNVTNRRAANPEKAQEDQRKYQKANRKKLQEKANKWKTANPDLVKAQKRRRHAKKQKGSDPIYAVANSFRARMRRVFTRNGFSKKSTTAKMLGCSWKHFCQHIEKQFTDNMSWGNRSDWHLDHILPLSCATTIDGLEKLSHYTNIRPLWAAENLQKSDNLVLIP
jgi:hypothetical protein